MDWNLMDMEDEQHQAAFGEHTGLSNRCIHTIGQIKKNNSYLDRLVLFELIEIGDFSDTTQRTPFL